MQTILRITSIRYRWLLGLLTLRVLIDGFNVLISMLIQLWFDRCTFRTGQLACRPFCWDVSGSGCLHWDLFLSGVVTERLKRRVSGDIATALMANFCKTTRHRSPIMELPLI